MKTIITVLDNISETSMPYNEFVLYRFKKNINEKNIIIVCGKKNNKYRVPNGIEVFYIQNNIFKIRMLIKRIIKNNSDVVIHMHQIHSAFLFNLAITGLKIKRKTLYTIHSTFSGYKVHNKIMCFYNCLSSKYITCVSDTSLYAIPKIIKRIKKNRIITIKNGFDMDRIDEIKTSNKEKNRNLIEFIYVARIIPLKNQMVLINSIKNMRKNIKLTLIGDDTSNYASQIKNMIKENKLEPIVEITGLISREKVFERLKNADIYISSSTLEGLPVSVLEAMYCNLPVILSDIPQHKEIVYDDKIISLVKNTVDSWQKIMEEYLCLEKKDLKKIGKKCKKYVIDNYSLAKMHEQYHEIYNKIRKKEE